MLPPRLGQLSFACAFTPLRIPCGTLLTGDEAFYTPFPVRTSAAPVDATAS